MKLNRNRSLIAVIALCAVISQAACQPSDVHAVKVKLDDAAKILNATAHANHDLYESGTYGPIGSAKAIEIREKVAKAVNLSNQALVASITVAKTLTASNLAAGKAQILAELAAGVQALAGISVGNQKIDLAIQAAAALLNDAVILTTALKG